MGTNFYFIKKQKHIGKRSAAGGGKLNFTYALTEKKINKLLDKYTVIDEYSHIYTKERFIEILKECEMKDYEMIGREFS